MIRKPLVILAGCLALASCGGEKHSELRAWVKQQDNLPLGRIPPLPEVRPYEPVEYTAHDMLDPFKPRKVEPPKGSAGAGGIQPPAADRRREPLEAYPLEALKMVGILQQKKAMFALVKSPDNNLFQVKTGNYLGQNFGRVVAITDTTIKLKEIVQDSSGNWEEKEQSLLLQE